jgi:hypothetical protein
MEPAQRTAPQQASPAHLLHCEKRSSEACLSSLLSSSLSGDHPSCLLPSQLLLQQSPQLLRCTLHQQTAAALDSQGLLGSLLLLQLLQKVAWYHPQLQLLQQQPQQQR